MFKKAYLVFLVILIANPALMFSEDDGINQRKRLVDFMGIEEQNFIYNIVKYQRLLALKRQIEHQRVEIKNSKKNGLTSVPNIFRFDYHMIG